MSLELRFALQFAVGFLSFILILFLPAGTLRYWEGWALLAVWFTPYFFFFLYYLKRDPELLKRRMLHKEKVKEQQVLMKALYAIFFLGYLIPGFDFRFGWSRRWAGPEPLWLNIVALGIILAAALIILWVMNVNRFAARTIQVEAGQKVITTGPYKWVRHPMYLGMCMSLPVVPLALGSYVAFPVFALFVPLIVLRLLNEEKVLRQDLPGYTEYCEETRHRLVPYVW
ncbi:MAG TPA: isoprenylcysteine carboxylmethyltransferase family protein [Candidatus Limnocylindrales bacterium]|nr:isoprenylcysteine carboxylmethyltransferase family protein [Candidatus Limnocylindrales bacterium]